MRYSELPVEELFGSFKVERISGFLAEGLAKDNSLLVGAATEELINRGEEETVAVIIRGAVAGGHFKVDSPTAVVLNNVITNSENKHPILRVINDQIVGHHPHEGGKLWVEKAIASVVDPQKSFNNNQELVQWFLAWLKKGNKSNSSNH